MSKALKAWLVAATVDDIRKLADTAGTSPAYLHQLATGHRSASAESAGRIADAANAIRKRRPVLPALSRAMLCAACAECPHAKECAK